jgi:large subunit ribosomal protein L29
MRAEKLRELDDNELVAQNRGIAEQLFRFRFQMGMGQMDGLKKYRALRKDRARILTVLQERKLTEPAQPETADEEES